MSSPQSAYVLFRPLPLVQGHRHPSPGLVHTTLGHATLLVFGCSLARASQLTRHPLGPKPDRPSPNRRCRLAVQWQEFGPGEHCRERLVRCIVSPDTWWPTPLTTKPQPSQRYRHRHPAAAHPAAHQPYAPAEFAREWSQGDDRGHQRCRRQRRGVGRVSAHSRPEVLRLQQDQRRDCPRDGFKDWPQRRHLARPHQPPHLLAQRPHLDPCRSARPDQGACWRPAQRH